MKNVLSILLLLIGFMGYAQDHDYNLSITSPISIEGNLEHGRALFGPTYAHNIEGNLTWAYSQIDSLACDSIITDLTNKIAFIRRGVCDFSLKVYHAQKAGALGVVIVSQTPDDFQNTMPGISMSDSVTIPSALITYEKGAELDSLIQAGQNVSIRFNSASLKNVKPYYASRVPKLLTEKWENFSCEIKNPHSTSVATDIYYEMVSPSNSIIAFGNVNLTPAASSFTGYYFTLSTPPTINEVGEYTLLIVSGLAPLDTFTESFEVTNNIFSFSSVDTFLYSRRISNALFATPDIHGDPYNFYIGSEIRTSNVPSYQNKGFSSDSVMISFGIYNEADLIGQSFTVEILEVPSSGYGTDPDSLTTIATASHTVMAEDTLINTDFIKLKMSSIQYAGYNGPEDRIIFKHGTTYIAIIKYQGSAAFPIPPRIFHTYEPVVNGINTVIYANILYSAGWADNFLQAQISVEFAGCLDNNVYDYSPSICGDDLLQINDSLYAGNSNVFQVIEDIGSNGCDSVLIGQTLSVENSDTTYLSDIICNGESYQVGTYYHTVTGTHTNTLVNAAGCDSVCVLELTVNPTSSTPLVESICSGETFTVGGSVYTSTGYYSNSFTNIYGCDSIVTLNLTVNPTSSTPLTESICEGESFMVGSSIYSSTGNFADTLNNIYGCDSIVTLNLTVNPTSSTPLTETICEGDSFIVGSSTYTTTGNYTTTLSNMYGCDSVVTLDLTVNPTSSTPLTESICEGESFMVGSSTYTTTGNFTNTLSNMYGCDSVVTLDLTVNPTSSTPLTESICEGENFIVGSSTYTSSGNYTNTLSNMYGCDSVVTLSLIVNPTSSTPLTETICEGDSFIVGSSTYTTTGNYTNTLSNMYGCDSVVTLDLTVNPTSSTPLTESICEGENYTVGSSIYTSTGTYTDTFMNVYGCDSIVSLDLTVHPLFNIPLAESICMGETFMVGSTGYTTTGNYSDTLTSINGCDSVVNLDLTINALSNTPLTESICEGESFMVGFATYTTTGNYVDTLSNMAGCDSIVVLDLNVNPTSSTPLTESICEGESYMVGSSIYTVTGNYTDVLTNMYGCDSIVDLNLIVNALSNTPLTEAICEDETFEVGSSSYTSTGNYADTLVNMNGCDSIVTLDLTVITIDLGVSINGTVLEADQTGSVSYQWLNCPDYSIINSATQQTYNPVSNGDYAVELTANGCVDTTDCFTISGIGTVELANSTFTVLPNPFTDKIVIDFHNEVQNGTLQLVNALGQVILKKDLNNWYLELETSTVNSGTYYLILNLETGVKTIKLIK
ncbi:MAG: PA domain-containing protein [Flavobacteriales bacterium]